MTNRRRAKANKCGRCQRRYRGHGEWNLTVRQGCFAEILCPQCQTPEENAQAEIRAATLDYYTDALGRIGAAPKAK